MPNNRNVQASFSGLLLGAVIGVIALVLVLPSLRRPPAPQQQAPPAIIPAPANAPETMSSAPAAPAVDLPTLQRLLAQEAARLPGVVSLHVRIEGGGEAGVQAGEAQPAASVIKLPIMVALEEAWKSGALKRTTRDEEAVRKAITESDNPSADWLIDRLGSSQINTWLEGHGYTQTRLRHKMAGPRPDGVNTVSAEEMTRLLLEIARGECVSAEASAEMRTLLLAQTRRTRIPAGLPAGTVCGNKTGTLRGIINDVAFVEPPSGPRYAVAVLISKGGADTPTSRAIAKLSKQVYELLNTEATKPTR